MYDNRDIRQRTNRLSVIMQLSIILHSDIYRAGLQLPRTTAVVQKKKV